jgi:hypothetical protein
MERMTNWWNLAGVLLSLCVGAPTSVAMDSLNVTLEGRWGYGASYAVGIVSPSHVAIGSGSVFMMIDVSNATEPAKSSEIILGGRIRSIAVEGTRVYVAADEAGLYVIDISNPSAAMVLGSCYIEWSAYSVVVSGSYAYVGTYSGEMRVIDVSDPSLPVAYSYCDLPSPAYGIAMGEGYVYVADGWDGLRVIDIGDPSAPVEVGFYETPDLAFGVAIGEGYAYVSESSGGLRVIDISDPSAPAEEGFIDTPGSGYGVAVNGAFAYVADGYDGLRVIDISDPSAPVEAGYCNDTLAPGYARAVAVSGKAAYVAHASRGLRVIDVSNAAAPVETGFFDTPADVADVVIEGANAYLLTNGRELLSIDISTPAVPLEQGQCSTHRTGDSRAAASENYLYAIGYGMSVVDISDPYAPQLAGSRLMVPPNGEDIALGAGYVYATSNYPNRLHVVDISNPQAPSEVGFLDMPASPEGIAVSGQYAYVATWDSGFRVIDISNPTSPIERASFAARDGLRGVAVSGGYAYLCAGTNLQVVDINNPLAPVEKGYCTVDGTTIDVAVNGSYAYVTTFSMGLRVIDISDPSAPVEHGYYETAGQGRRVVVSGDLVYVVDSYYAGMDYGNWSGLYVFRFTAPSAPPAPTNLLATAVSSTEIDLTWVDTPNETGYKVERADGLTNLVWEQIATTEEDVPDFQDTDLSAESIYTYRVIAYNDIGESQPSNTDSAKTYSSQAVPPPAPAAFLATAASATQIDLTWDDTQYETGYTIERAPAVDGPWGEIATPPEDATGYQDTGLSPSTTYFYRVYAYNDAGDGPYSEIVWATTSALDTEGPSIVIQQPSPPAAGVATTITATINDTSGVQSAMLWYRPGGGTVSSVTMSGGNGDYSGTIPSSAVTPSGVGYYVEALDMSDNSNREPAVGYQSLQVSVSGEGVVCSSPQPGGSQQTAYRLVSIPMDASSDSPAAVLVDDLGAYDNTRWRFFELNPDQGYTEYPNTNPMIPGKAFWLIVHEGGKVIDTGPCLSVPTGGEYQLPVHAGWTLVGNPFNFSIPVTNLRFASGSEQAVLRSYAGAWNDPTAAAVTVMEPFQGYAVSSQSATQLLVDPILPSGGVLAKSALEDSVAWTIRVHARCQDALDVDNIALASRGASREFDSLDRPEPPVIGGYVSVCFPHPEWETVFRTYSVDARPIPQEGDVWLVEVRSNIRDLVHLRFKGVEAIPAETGVVLFDEATNASLNLREVQEYSFANTREDIARRLKIIVGNQDFVMAELEKAGVYPLAFGLSQNFPNPFNPLTTIGYSLPAPSHVTMKLYDMVGREVATLVEGLQAPGRRSVVLDGSRLASGVYYYRMRATAVEGSAASYVQTRKLLLLK